MVWLNKVIGAEHFLGQENIRLECYCWGPQEHCWDWSLSVAIVGGRMVVAGDSNIGLGDQSMLRGREIVVSKQLLGYYLLKCS